MCPITHFSFLALGLSIVAAFIFGALWYGPILGKAWAECIGINFDKDSCKGKPPVSALLFTLAGTVSTVIVLAYILGNCKLCCPMSGAFMVWIGFYVPLQLGPVTWERRPWKFFAINAVYAFLSLQLVAAILTFVK